MIDRLAELGEKLRTDESHDALKEEIFSIIISIDNDGKYQNISRTDPKITAVEKITNKKGKTRLLLDTAVYTLGYNPNDIDKNCAKELEQYKEKLAEYVELSILEPVKKFYGNFTEEVKQQILGDFSKEIPKYTGENIVFLNISSGTYFHNRKEVLEKIKEKYDTQMSQNLSTSSICSICTSGTFPIIESHASIKNIPGTTNPKLVSFNEDAFESYLLKKSGNSCICARCAANYTSGLNYLLTEGIEVTTAKGGKYINYKHRKELSYGQYLLFWVKNKPSEIPAELSAVENPDELDWINAPNPKLEANVDSVKSSLNSPAGKENKVYLLDNEQFYALTLTGESGRIAIRSWHETTIGKVRKNLNSYFEGIRIYSCWDEKNIVSPLGSIVKKSISTYDPKKKDYKEIGNVDHIKRKISEALWKCALQGEIPPISILLHVLRRIYIDGNIPLERAGLIKLILNKNSKKGEQTMTERCEKDHSSIAYQAGQLFAVLEKVQKDAIGNVNAGIGERYFSSAATTPATAFARLMKLNKNHLSKLAKGEYGSSRYEKEIQSICLHINEFPDLFSLKDQGRFALGYYHKKQELYTKKETTNE